MTNTIYFDNIVRDGDSASSSSSVSDSSLAAGDQLGHVIDVRHQHNLSLYSSLLEKIMKKCLPRPLMPPQFGFASHISRESASPRDSILSKGSSDLRIEGEYVAAGWPSWLAAVAGEAIVRDGDSASSSSSVSDYSLAAGDQLGLEKSHPLPRPLMPPQFGRLQSDTFERKRPDHPGIGGVPKGIEGEYVAAGWPSWLAAVAGEAIRGWIPRRADSFEKFDRIGQGTYSNVYRARDLDRGKIVALKKVRFDNLEPESVRFMAREINILRRLDHPNIIKLEGLVTSRMSCSLYLVFEYMEHDLAGLASFPGQKFTEAQVKCYMQQLLRGLDHCHSRGVLHRDIKGSNLLIDNSGILKIAGFGLASFFDPHQNQPLTSRVVTLWYRPPELILGETHYGISVDLWSTGCILAELYAGKPIMPGRTEVEQLHKIFKLCGSPSEDYWRKSKLPHATIFKPQQPFRRIVADTFKDFPSPALGLMETLLSIDPADRGTATAALKSEFFTTPPFACDPSSLPIYPPSKEFDAKARDEEARRQKAASGRGQRTEQERRTRESRAVSAPDANAELVMSMQKRQSQSNSKSRSEKFNPNNQEDIASGFPIDPPRSSQVLDRDHETSRDTQSHYIKRASHSGPSVHRAAWAKAASGKIQDDAAPKVSTGADLSTLSSLVAARSMLKSSGPSQPEMSKLPGPGSFNDKQDRRHAQGLSQRDDGRNGSKDRMVGYGSKGNKIHYSGPLLAQPGNVDQMLKDHDRHIQEAVRRARIDKAKTRKVQGDGPDYSIFSSGRGAM